jgi:hypothetical protein
MVKRHTFGAVELVMCERSPEGFLHWLFFQMQTGRSTLSDTPNILALSNTMTISQATCQAAGKQSRSARVADGRLAKARRQCRGKTRVLVPPILPIHGPLPSLLAYTMTAGLRFQRRRRSCRPLSSHCSPSEVYLQAHRLVTANLQVYWMWI